MGTRVENGGIPSPVAVGSKWKEREISTPAMPVFVDERHTALRNCVDGILLQQTWHSPKLRAILW